MKNEIKQKDKSEEIIKRNSILQVTDSDFDELVLKSSYPVMVECTADWCGPCHIFQPVINQIAKVYKNQLNVVQLNKDENNLIVNEYGIHRLPTFLFFYRGILLHHISGSVPKSKLIGLIEEILTNFSNKIKKTNNFHNKIIRKEN